jgi:hypothetical protein
MQQRSVWVAVALTATATVSMGGCAIDELDGESEVTQEAIVVRPCGGDECGENSPVIDVFSWHDAGLRGQSNNIGLRIDTLNGVAQIVKGFTSYDLVVQDAKIKGVRGNTTITGTQLIGAMIPITHGKARYQIAIRDARELDFFVAPRAVKVGVYQFEVRSGEGMVMELCSNRKLLEKLLDERRGEEGFAQQELMGMRTWETVVFEGDRFNATTKTTSKDSEIDDTWINFGCAGHMLAKLLLTHNTYHFQVAAGQAWQRRQATMKMYAADYCGDGVPFTVPGQKVVWRGDAMTDFFWPARELEARWDEKGAICLDVPRLVHATSAFGRSTYPDVRASIVATCVRPGRTPPPPCANRDPYTWTGEYRVTGNP